MLIRRAFCACSKIVSPAEMSSPSSTTSRNTFSRGRFGRRRLKIKPPPFIEQDSSSSQDIENDGFKVEEAALNLTKLLGYKIWKSNMLVRKYPQFHEISLPVLEQRVSYLEDKNVEKTRIANMSWLLLLDSEDLLEQVTYIEKILVLDFNCAVCFVKQLEEHWLNRIMHLWRAERAAEEEFTRPGTLYRNRVDYMADRLETKPSAVADMMVYRATVAALPFNKIRFILDLLIEEAAIPRTEICMNPFLFMQNISLMENRIMMAKKLQIPTITSSFLRTKNDQFNVTLMST